VAHSLFSLGYAELQRIMREAYRRGRRLRRCKNIHKSLLEACVGFTKKGFKITDVAVIARLRVALRDLGIINRRVRVLVEGEIKALEMQIRFRDRKVFNWAPQLKAWLKCQAYKFWLGAMQISLEGKVCLMVGPAAEGFPSTHV